MKKFKQTIKYATCLSKNVFKTSFKQLISIDFFSLKPGEHLTFEDTQNYSSLLGQLSSWIFIIFTIALFYYYGSNLFFHQNPQSSISQTITNDPPYIDLVKNRFFMAFGLQDLRNHSFHYIDESIYTIQMIQRVKIDSNITLSNIPIQKCSLEMVPDFDDLKEYYRRNQINNLYCVSNDSNIELALQSTWDGPLYKNLLINVLPCKNTTENGNICKPFEIIQGYLDSGNYAIYFNPLAVDPQNYDKPIATYGKQIYTPISYSTLTYIEMNFNHLEFISDKGMLLEDSENIHQATYTSFRQVLSISSDLIVQIDMKLDKIFTVYTRKYDKIQDILSNVGGIIQILMILVYALVSPCITLSFKLKLANKMFQFKKENNKPPLQIFDFRAGKINKRILLPNIKNSQIFFSEYLKSWCYDESGLFKDLFNNGMKQINHLLDISYLIKKFMEIDILKLLLLDDDQMKLFEKIPKPTITCKKIKKKSRNSFHTLNISFEKGVRQRKSVFDPVQINSKIIKTKLDEKLLHMISNPSLKMKQNISQKFI